MTTNPPPALCPATYSSVSSVSDDSELPADADWTNSDSGSVAEQSAPTLKRRRSSAIEDVPPTNKPKRNAGTPRNAGFAIADQMKEYLSFQKMQAQASSAPSFEALATQRAIAIVNEEYGGKFDGDEMSKAYEVLMNFANANAFCVMGTGEARDKWLKRNIEIIN